MTDRQLPTEEKVLKEYPYSTRMMEGRAVIGVGNLVLTNRRLVFLHQVNLSPEQVQNLQKMAQHGTTEKSVDFVLTLDKRNFQVPLASVVSARVGLYTMLPFPRPCLRITYQKKKSDIKTVTFMFTIPLLRGFFQFEIFDDLVWVKRIRTAMKPWLG